MYFSQIRVDPTDDKYLYVLGISLYRSIDGGKTFKGDGGNGVHPDQHALWIDPRTAGTCSSAATAASTSPTTAWTTGTTSTTMAIGQFYQRLRRFAAAVLGLRRLAGQRQLGRPEPVAERRPRSTRTGSPSSAATASSARSIRPTPTWSTPNRRTAPWCGATSRRAKRPASARTPRWASRPTASTGTRRSSCRTTTRTSSTAAAITSSAPWSRATSRRSFRRRSRGPSAARRRPWPSRRRTPTCCGPAPTTAPCG